MHISSLKVLSDSIVQNVLSRSDIEKISPKIFDTSILELQHFFLALSKAPLTSKYHQLLFSAWDTIIDKIENDASKSLIDPFIDAVTKSDFFDDAQRYNRCIPAFTKIFSHRYSPQMAGSIYMQELFFIGLQCHAWSVLKDPFKILFQHFNTIQLCDLRKDAFQEFWDLFNQHLFMAINRNDLELTQHLIEFVDQASSSSHFLIQLFSSPHSNIITTLLHHDNIKFWDLMIDLLIKWNSEPSKNLSLDDLGLTALPTALSPLINRDDIPHHNAILKHLERYWRHMATDSERFYCTIRNIQQIAPRFFQESDIQDNIVNIFRSTCFNADEIEHVIKLVRSIAFSQETICRIFKYHSQYRQQPLVQVLKFCTSNDLRNLLTTLRITNESALCEIILSYKNQLIRHASGAQLEMIFDCYEWIAEQGRSIPFLSELYVKKESFSPSTPLIFSSSDFQEHQNPEYKKIA